MLIRTTIMLLLGIFSVNSHADVKQLRCSAIFDGEVYWVRDFIFNTEDFTKESPQAETILVKYKEDKDRIWIEEKTAAAVGINVATHYETMGVGITYRTRFEVTPSFLTFDYVTRPECLNKLGYSSSAKEICDFSMTPQKLNISRKTLSNEEENNVCKLSDYKMSENLL
jgi:hypothetical protein